ncbi:hypothetical protein [Candidatus Oscillochloris fontis]|uniref:hypothetical protein n=1 Tax=Candidatus Oscillochloris fontis TaxID=2496868 RepID=UPI00101D3AC9|nr:hypothetical protein [Candidatus Oscillochloris fontis]
MHHDKHETTRDWLRRAVGLLRGGNMPLATNEVDVAVLHWKVQDVLAASEPPAEDTRSQQTWAYAGLVKAIKRCGGGSLAFEEDDVE